ncbi:hypothetical protein [Spirosoma utsteinense]|uniref:Uncharacterized protein n=1 Tax=Spirosoma utsteinense TaxID=2585773 RepID=A0ABR6W5Q9_9BACT|nr:hypothetical protein [Spirosoma utsteinense]MBC3786300.1 hypothetical protein [Spirosoma utsteinense]MBC3791926.1 hypothetical protein [Spirosoma utsteinense]
MPERSVQYLPECHADTALLRHFIPDHSFSIHCLGCPEVANTMLSPRAENYRLIGLVDNDPDLDSRCGGFFKTFTLVEHAHKVELRMNATRQQYLIVIDRAVETFLIWNAQQVGIDMLVYGFTPDVKQLRRLTKSPSIETDPNYRQLLADLHDQQAPGFLTLERILNDVTTT